MGTQFSQLWQEFPYRYWGELEDVLITGIAVDSRKVDKGNVFIAIKGYTVDSHQYIRDAVQRGAMAVVGSRELSAIGVPYIRVENSRLALAHLAAAFYGHPGKKLTMIGVTGTDGKTTTVNLLYQILKAAGFRAGMISTVNAVIGDEIIDTGFHVTTPEALDIQKYLSLMVENQLTHCILETTSHGWEQYRTDACEFDIGIFTNITHEHLDMHGSYEGYRAAKARLIESLAQTKPKNNRSLRIAIINRDDLSFDYLQSVINRQGIVKELSYGLGSDADITAEHIQNDITGLYFIAQAQKWHIPVKTTLLGEFNVSNCLAAIAATVEGLGIAPEIASSAIKLLPGVAGRMEEIDLGQEFKAIVDFAHTPNALRKALVTARKLIQGKVIAVFGSAGLRDTEKRRLMASVSVELADITVITAEDPRTEPLEMILNEMSAEARARGAQDGVDLFVIADRGEAIRKAVRIAKAGDIIMLCGKGHEQSMCFGTIEYPWDDRTALRAALAERLGIVGSDMPVLPTS
jgi:UDP-N-acetylmuramoyl-L-alanyl-D-glutamate--2,6-diaminopimelate ligase